MLLSSLVNKPIVVAENIRGICLGVGVSLKSYAVKYLLCASSPNRIQTDFCVNTSALDKIDEAVFLKQLRPVFPKNCAQITLGLPVFTSDGCLIGKLADVELQNLVATRLFTEKRAFSISSVAACSDAVILRKEQPFPLGQRVPAPLLSNFDDKFSPIVNKAFLRSAIEKKALITLTLSLPPFNVSFLPLTTKFKD